MKKHKLTSTEAIDLFEFECLYSPAKRRGPVPGRAGQTRKASEAFGQPTGIPPYGTDWTSQGTAISVANGASMPGIGGPHSSGGMIPAQSLKEIQLRQMMTLQNSMTGGSAGGNVVPGIGGGPGGSRAHGPVGMGALGSHHQQDTYFDSQQVAIQQQLNIIQQMQAQQMVGERSGVRRPQGVLGIDTSGSTSDGLPSTETQAARRMKLGHQHLPKSHPQQQQQQDQPQSNGVGTDSNGVPKTIAAHTHLLELSDPDGSRLRAYYRLSVDEVFGFPPTPTDEEYCSRLNIPGMTPRMIPGTHLAALSAARFAEVSLGAIVHNEISLAMELCNAVVHCLKESVQEPVQPPYMFEVARSYFLLAVFRAFRGDMVRYFKYRRVCLTYVSKLEDAANATTLIAAVSFLDAWAYMIYNADEKKVPQIDHSIPPVERTQPSMMATAVEMEYSVKCNPGCIASDPRNQNWIQGAPPVFLNNEAPLRARSLDALAFAVRTCCDQANGRFAAISKEAKADNIEPIPQETIITPTTTAVLAHENELCSRNMVLSAFTLLQQYETVTPNSHKNQGMHLVMSAMDAFLDNGEEDETGGFTDSQIQSLLSVSNIVIENPLLLHHAGPTYHMVSNAAVMLCHLLNSMYMMKGGADGIRNEQLQGGGMEAAMFEEILDTFTAVRKLLVIHRRNLPIKLRCHSIPRPSLVLPEDGKPFLDLGETLLCACRGCQGFVLMACSPIVAAQKAQAASTKRSVEAAREAQVEAADELDKELDVLSHDFNLDDDALLGMLSQLISS